MSPHTIHNGREKRMRRILLIDFATQSPSPGTVAAVRIPPNFATMRLMGSKRINYPKKITKSTKTQRNVARLPRNFHPVCVELCYNLACCRAMSCPVLLYPVPTFPVLHCTYTVTVKRKRKTTPSDVKMNVLQTGYIRFFNSILNPNVQVAPKQGRSQGGGGKWAMPPPLSRKK